MHKNFDVTVEFWDFCLYCILCFVFKTRNQCSKKYFKVSFALFFTFFYLVKVFRLWRHGKKTKNSYRMLPLVNETEYETASAGCEGVTIFLRAVSVSVVSVSVSSVSSLWIKRRRRKRQWSVVCGSAVALLVCLILSGKWSQFNLCCPLYVFNLFWQI